MKPPALKFYFGGVDPAPALGKRSDDGAIVLGRATARVPEPAPLPTDWWFDFVYAQVLRGYTVDQWSGVMHMLHRRYHLAGYMLDPGGGGTYIGGKANQRDQIINGVPTICRPIACPEDPTTSDADFILHYFKRGDLGIEALWPDLKDDGVLKDNMHVHLQEACEHVWLRWPPGWMDRPPEDRPQPGTERAWSVMNLEAMRRQLMHIQVLCREDGTWALTRSGTRQYVTTQGHDDIAMAGMMAYVRFLIWLKTGEEDFAGTEDAASYMLVERVSH